MKTMIKFQALANILILTFQTGPKSRLFIPTVLVMREQSLPTKGNRKETATNYCRKKCLKIPCTVSGGLLTLVVPTNQKVPAEELDAPPSSEVQAVYSAKR